jgi:AAA+ superfamily predicted ATPase
MSVDLRAATTDMRAIIAHARALLSRAVRVAWDHKVLTRDSDGLFSGVLGAGDIEKMLERAGAEGPGVPALAADRLAVPRLRALLDTIGCDPVCDHVLSVALAVELDDTARTLAGYLRGNAQSVGLNVATLVLGLGDDHVPELLLALGAGAPLRRHRLIEVVEKSGELISSGTLRAAPRLLRWLVDPARVDDEVLDLGRLEAPGPEPALSPGALAALDEVISELGHFLTQQRALARSRTDLVLRGPRGSGRSEIAREACRRLGVPALVVPLANILGQQNPADVVGTLLRETLLLDAQLVLEGWEGLPSAEDQSQRVRVALAASSRPLVITSTTQEQQRIGGGRAMVVRDVRIIASHEREVIWGEVLPEVNARETASLYRVGVGAIGRVAEGARLRALVRGKAAPGANEVFAAVASEFETDLGAVATRVDVSQTWDDLVVGDDTGRTITALISQLRNRATVLGRWGFQRKLGKGLGMTALFSGGPGTGKSMVAGLIARDLGLDLYQIDLSRVMSKWIGETEKNLARLFDAAEVGHVVLLFDEADALLGKRTADVKSSNDRYANLETNYILQRLEAFHGIAILTSNLESSIDPALSRRLSFALRFPFPDEQQRAKIWRRMLPAELPVVGEIDFARLAKRFELSGGYIRNIVLRAAYLAAAAGRAGLAMEDLLAAAEHEYRDHGRFVAEGRLA